MCLTAAIKPNIEKKYKSNKSLKSKPNLFFTRLHREYVAERIK